MEAHQLVNQLSLTMKSSAGLLYVLTKRVASTTPTSLTGAPHCCSHWQPEEVWKCEAHCVTGQWGNLPLSPRQLLSSEHSFLQYNGPVKEADLPCHFDSQLHKFSLYFTDVPP